MSEPKYQMSKEAAARLKKEGYRNTRVGGGKDSFAKEYYESAMKDERPEAKSTKEYRKGKGASHFRAVYRADRKKAAKRR